MQTVSNLYEGDRRKMSTTFIEKYYNTTYNIIKVNKLKLESLNSCKKLGFYIFSLWTFLVFVEKIASDFRKKKIQSRGSSHSLAETTRN